MFHHTKVQIRFADLSLQAEQAVSYIGSIIFLGSILFWDKIYNKILMLELLDWKHLLYFFKIKYRTLYRQMQNFHMPINVAKKRLDLKTQLGFTKHDNNFHDNLYYIRLYQLTDPIPSRVCQTANYPRFTLIMFCILLMILPFA